MTREEWLNCIVRRSRFLFQQAGSPLPNGVRVGVAPAGGKALGTCWSEKCSEDGGREIWLSPKLTDPLEIAGCLIHELCHAALPHEVKHTAPFKHLGEALLLEGKPTSMTGGEAFAQEWGPFLEELGPYPGVRFDPDLRTKQSTRMIKVECQECGFLFRTSAKWIDASGELTCPNMACRGEVEVS